MQVSMVISSDNLYNHHYYLVLICPNTKLTQLFLTVPENIQLQLHMLSLISVQVVIVMSQTVNYPSRLIALVHIHLEYKLKEFCGF